MRSKVDANSGPAVGGNCGNVSGSISGLPLSPVKLNRAVAAETPRLMPIRLKSQVPSEATCPSEPAVAKPAIEAADCSMVKVWSAMVNELETPPPKFGRTWKVTLPLPTPEPLLVNVTPAGSAPTDQGQSAPAVTVIVPVPPWAASKAPKVLQQDRQLRTCKAA
ncbi:MAG: hypothetical protein LAP61_19440 [Acidobacteriia bacterium]|nr:hypothetical protein [Terriglobia bacterium]